MIIISNFLAFHFSFTSDAGQRFLMQRTARETIYEIHFPWH